MPNAVVRPSRIKLHSTELSTDVIRGVGFRAVCACGYRGSLHDRHDAARADARQHNLEHRQT